MVRDVYIVIHCSYMSWLSIVVIDGYYWLSMVMSGCLWLIMVIDCYKWYV